jgi:hypothetical protein
MIQDEAQRAELGATALKAARAHLDALERTIGRG